MIYYEIALLKSPLNPLTYQSEDDLEVGQKVEVSLRNRKNLSLGVVVKIVDKPTFRCIDIQNILDEYYDKKMLEVAKFISQYYVCSLGEALSLYIPFQKDIFYKDEKKEFDCDIKLSKVQQKALNFLDDNPIGLLFANTGSGKTEIYIKAIQKHINQNREAILLMPEISLTPQMEKRLKKVFGDAIAIWHSKIQKKEKTRDNRRIVKW